MHVVPAIARTSCKTHKTSDHCVNTLCAFDDTVMDLRHTHSVSTPAEEHEVTKAWWPVTSTRPYHYHWQVSNLQIISACLR